MIANPSVRALCWQSPRWGSLRHAFVPWLSVAARSSSMTIEGAGMRRLVAGVSTSILVLGACSSVSFVDELSIINDTEYSANVEVTDEGRDGWLALNNVESQSTTVVEDVIDQGEVWVFRFEYLDRYQVEVEVSSRELAQSDWSIEVPQSFEQGLRDMGVPPPP
jgi:hypothetical protein